MLEDIAKNVKCYELKEHIRAGGFRAIYRAN